MTVFIVKLICSDLDQSALDDRDFRYAYQSKSHVWLYLNHFIAILSGTNAISAWRAKNAMMIHLSLHANVRGVRHSYTFPACKK